MKSHIIKIGNSRGIRLPKTLIEQTGIDDEVEIEVSGNTLIIRPASSPRMGWGQAFREMAAVKDDALLDSESIHCSQWDEEDWEW